jgi:protease-4
MKRPSIWLSLLPFLLLTGGPTGALADTPPLSSIPSYYGLLQWNLTSPSAFSTAAGGYANPAVYSTMPAFEGQFSWTDVDNSFSSLGDWGLFLGGTNIGFGVVRNEIPVDTTGQIAGVNDMRIAISGRDRHTSFGLGFGWSSGDDKLVGRSDIFQIGLTHRVGRYVSLGVSGDFALNNSNQQGLFDLAVRPLANQIVTVFGDINWPKGFSFKDAPWSAGAMVEPVAGLQLIGRYFENESYTFSLGFSFGALGLYGTPRYNKDNNRTNTTYQIRSGYPQRSFIDNAAAKNKYYLSVNLKGPVKYRGYKYFDTPGNRLLDLERDLDHAITDPAIRGVAINMSGMSVTRGKAWEIREKLAQVRRAGKHVVVYTDEMGMTELHLASVADKIVFDPQGSIVIPGYVIGRTFVKDALVKLGIGFDEWRFLKYKSAAEAFSRTTMSEADREQRLGLIEDFYATTRSGVTTGRGVSGDTFDKWINEDILISPTKAVEVGLVDQLGRWDDVAKVIEELEGSKKRYRSRHMLAENHYPSNLWGEDPEIAVVYALGYCGMDTGIRARKLEKIVKRVVNDRFTKAIVIRVDSPGGEALASDLVAERIRAGVKKKPIIISQGDVAASGGYWLSMYGTEIYALPQTIVGSIGVIGGWIWNDGIGEKIGHTSDHVKVGDKADFNYGIRLLLAGPMLPERNLTTDERDQLIGELEGFYQGFVKKVADGRQMTVEDVEAVAQGHVFSGIDGKEIGLVDEIGSLDDAIKAAARAAGIEDDEPITIVEYPKMPPFRIRFGGGPLGPLARLLGWGDGNQETEADMEWLYNPEWLYVRSLFNNPGRPLFMLPPEYNVYDGKWGPQVGE